MQLDQVRPGRARRAALTLAGLVSTLAITSTTPAFAQSPSPPRAGHAGHGAPAAATAAQTATCRRWTPPASTGVVRVRPNASKLNAFQIAALRAGVEAMKARADTDPTSWIYQANMHGTTDDRNLPGWNSCQHENYMFLPWHRMYLYFFERILSKAAGVDVPLPYWNYSDPNSLSLPLAYYSPATASRNPLYLEQRAPGMNSGCTLQPDDGDYSYAFGMIDFAAKNQMFHGARTNPSFGGQFVDGPTHFDSPPGEFEHQPHDLIHNVVGGPNGYMAIVELAARDPIFWAHHANIDRLWSKWLAQGGGRTDPPKSDTVWRNTQFTFFDENGACVLMTGDEVVNTAQQLSYRYDDEPASPSKAGETTSAAPRTKTPVASAATNGKSTNGGATNGAAAPALTQVLAETVDGPVQVTGRRRAVPIAIAPERKEAIRALAQTAAAATPKRVALLLTNFEYAPGAYYKVYLNLPESEQNPTAQSPHYVGVIAPFSTHARPGDPDGLTLGFDLTPVIQKLAAAGQWTGDALTVTFVPRERAACPEGQTLADEVLSGNVKVGRLRILTTP